MTQSWWHYVLVSSLIINGAIAVPTRALAQIISDAISPNNFRLTINGNSTDVTKLIIQGCPANVRSAASKFVFTGRGGLPPNPREALASEQPLVDLGTPVQHKGDRPLAISSTDANTEAPTLIVEAQGWLIDSHGEIVLTTASPTVTPHDPWLTVANCHTPLKL